MKRQTNAFPLKIADFHPDVVDRRGEGGMIASSTAVSNVSITIVWCGA